MNRCVEAEIDEFESQLHLKSELKKLKVRNPSPSIHEIEEFLKEKEEKRALDKQVIGYLIKKGLGRDPEAEAEAEAPTSEGFPDRADITKALQDLVSFIFNHSSE